MRIPRPIEARLGATPPAATYEDSQRRAISVKSPAAGWPGPGAPRSNKCVDITTTMSVKTVTLTEEAHNALASLKREGESFSQVVSRLTGSRILLSTFAGAWSGAPPACVDEVRRYLQNADRASRTELVRLGRMGRPRD